MNLIFLKGRGGVGKTSTLKLVAKELVKKGAEIIYQSMDLMDAIKISRADLHVILRYEGKVVGVCTYGDTRKCIEDAMECFRKYDCETGFCAMRLKGETTHCVDELKKSNQVIILNKAFVDDKKFENAVNENQKECLLEIYRLL